MADDNQRRAIQAPAGQLILDGKPIGWVQEVSAVEVFETRAIKEVGKFWTVKVEHVGGSVAGSFGIVTIKNEPLEALGLLPEGDSPATTINLPDLTLALASVDSADGEVFRQYEGVKLTSLAWDFQVGQVMAEQVSWQGTRPTRTRS